MELNNWSVYKHISPSGKVYVGITSKKCSSRWGISGKRYLFKQKNGDFAHPAFAAAIIKYGWDTFEHIIVESGLTEEEAKNMEKELISIYKGKGISYNITDGGDGRLGVSFKHSEESKKAISLHHRRFQLDSTKRKISETQKGVKFPEWRKKLLSEAHSHERIKVAQYDKEGNFIASYISIMDASRATGIPNALIASAIKRNGSSYGYLWKKIN